MTSRRTDGRTPPRAAEVSREDATRMAEEFAAAFRAAAATRGNRRDEGRREGGGREGGGRVGRPHGAHAFARRRVERRPWRGCAGRGRRGRGRGYEYADGRGGGDARGGHGVRSRFRSGRRSRFRSGRRSRFVFFSSVRVRHGGGRDGGLFRGFLVQPRRRRRPRGPLLRGRALEPRQRSQVGQENHQGMGGASRFPPESIWVRVYEDRMDCLRAAMVGPEGTPYHDNLFVFDFHFHAQYPAEPPRGALPPRSDSASIRTCTKTGRCACRCCTRGRARARRCGTPTEAACCRCSSPSRVSCSSISPTTTRRGTRNRWEATRASATPRSTTSRRFRERKVDALPAQTAPGALRTARPRAFQGEGKDHPRRVRGVPERLSRGRVRAPKEDEGGSGEAPQRKKSRAETLRRLREGSNSCSRNSCRNPARRSRRTNARWRRARKRANGAGERGMRTDDDTRSDALSLRQTDRFR